MRNLLLSTIFIFGLISGACAQEIDFAKVAVPERTRLAECFSDMLAVIERYHLSEELIAFLEAGCDAEMHNYREALRPSWSKDSQQSDTEKFLAKKAK